MPSSAIFFGDRAEFIELDRNAPPLIAVFRDAQEHAAPLATPVDVTLAMWKVRCPKP